MSLDCFKMCFNVFFKQEIKIHIQVIEMISLKLSI